MLFTTSAPTGLVRSASASMARLTWAARRVRAMARRNGAAAKYAPDTGTNSTMHPHGSQVDMEELSLAIRTISYSCNPIDLKKIIRPK